MSGDLSLSTGIASIGGSDALNIGSGSSASGSGGSIAISVGSSTDIRGAFSVPDGDSLALGAAGGDLSIISGSSLASSSGNLTLATEDGNSMSKGDSGALDIGSGVPVSGLGGRIAISVGSSTSMGGTTSVSAGTPFVSGSLRKKSKSIQISIDMWDHKNEQPAGFALNIQRSETMARVEKMIEENVGVSPFAQFVETEDP